MSDAIDFAGFAVLLFGGAATLAAAIAVIVPTVLNRIETGKWRLPTVD